MTAPRMCCNLMLFIYSFAVILLISFKVIIQFLIWLGPLVAQVTVLGTSGLAGSYVEQRAK